MQHLLLVGGELCPAYLLLHLLEVFGPDLEDIDVLLRAQEQLVLGELLRQGQLHKVHWLHQRVAGARQS
jgi:hypothetical protein